jgi:hypothetical protein
MLWNSTHRDVHPAPTTFDETWNKALAYGAAIKQQDPAAKVTGPVTKANGLWTNASGTLKLVLQQGTAVPGVVPAANLASITAYSMRNDDLIVSLKLAGPPTTSAALVRLANNNAGTLLLRAGQTGLMLNGVSHTVKSFTVLTSAVGSPGDGRWDGDDAVVVKVSAFETAAPTKKRDALLRFDASAGGTPLVLASGGATAAVAGLPASTFKTFGLPAIGDWGARYAFLTTLNPLTGSVTPANDTALVYSSVGIAFNAFAREGDSPVDATISSLKYAKFTDPVIVPFSAAGARAAFVATFAVAPGVTGANNRALIAGDPSSAALLFKVARTGVDTAAAPVDDTLTPTEPATKYASFTVFALPSGLLPRPIFLSKLSGAATAANNLGLFAVSSTGQIRRLLRTGEDLGGQKVKTITLLKAVPKAFGAARSFNGTGSVVVALTFTNRKSALLELAIP